MGLNADTFERVLLACVSTGDDRRDTTRTATSITVPMFRQYNGERSEVITQVTNVSVDGMGFVTEVNLKVGEQLLVELPAAGAHQHHLRLITQVRHTHARPDGKWAVGSQFVSPACEG